MSVRSDDDGPKDPLRDKIIGLGEQSFRKSYYPELQRRLADLERFRALLDESSDAILMIDVFDGRLTDVNGSVCRYLGIDRATLLKMTAYDLIDSATVDRIVKLFTGQDECLNITVEVRGAGGRTIPFEFTIKIVTLNGTSHAVAVGRDITERRRAEEQLRMTQFAVDHSADPALWLDERGHILYVNEATCESLGYERGELLSMWIWDIDPMFPPEIYARNWNNWRQMSLEGDDSWKRFESIHRTKSGEIRQVEVSTDFAVFQGKVYLITTDRDITERRATEEQIKATLREKEVMLKEIHHRVKNNLQIISSLLSIQSQYLADSRDLELFRRSQDRVRSMALVHEQLYQTDDLAAIDFAPYVESLVRNLVASYRGDAGNVRLKLDVAGVFLGIDTAIPCGLIINELASNALKHAFPGNRAGQLTVYMRHEDGSYVLEVGDDGTGLSHPQDIRKSQSMGLQLVTLLTEQLDGTISIDASCGTRFRITFNGPLAMKSAGGGKENDVPGRDD